MHKRTRAGSSEVTQEDYRDAVWNIQERGFRSQRPPEVESEEGQERLLQAHEQLRKTRGSVSPLLKEAGDLETKDMEVLSDFFNYNSFINLRP